MSERSTDPAYLRYQYGTAEKLNIRIASHERYSERALDFRAWVLQWLDLAPGLTVLDVGCGSGAFHRALGRHDVRVIACDRSPGMVQEVLAQAAQYRLPVGACQSDAEALPFAAGSCDRVMANHMLYHVPDQEQALRELRRVLKPGGRVVMATNAADHSRRFRVLQRGGGQLGYTPPALSAGSRSMICRWCSGCLRMPSGTSSATLSSSRLLTRRWPTTPRGRWMGSRNGTQTAVTGGSCSRSWRRGSRPLSSGKGCFACPRAGCAVASV